MYEPNSPDCSQGAYILHGSFLLLLVMVAKDVQVRACTGRAGLRPNLQQSNLAQEDDYKNQFGSAHRTAASYVRLEDAFIAGHDGHLSMNSITTAL